MTEPENHTILLLREMRDDLRRLERKMDRGFAEVKLSIDGLSQSLAGEIATRGYALGGIER